ncbi:MAG: amidohydrolase family protein [Proteobacteria bacterium]|nr:amidohydrolase family protein [Pseudomonadota bacterium]
MDQNRIIANVTVVDGLGGRLADRFVAVENGVIAEIGAAGDLPATPRLPVEDGTGRTLMPGLIDCHVHLSLDGAPDAIQQIAGDPPAVAALRLATNAERSLAAGITTVRDLGAKLHVDIDFRKAVIAGIWHKTPRLVLSGRPLTMTGGHCWQFGREADGPDELRKAAREQIKAGADWIKLIASGGILSPGTEPESPQLEEAEMRAAIEEAHKAGRRAAVHAHGAAGIKNALRAGIDSVEHAYFLDDEAIEMMLERDAWLVPTTWACKVIVQEGHEGGIPCHAVMKAEAALERQRESFRKAHAAGVRIAMGTDAGTPYNRHGENARELETMVELGMTPMEAICASTGLAAELLGLADRIGAIETGREADLLLVDGDPLGDISVLCDRANIAQVYKAGVPVHAEPGAMAAP